MSSYTTNQAWSQGQSTYSQPQLQLEHEFDFSNIDPTSETQSQQSPMFADSYQFSQPHFPSGNFAPSANGFTSNQPQPSQRRTGSYGSNHSGGSRSIDSTTFPVHGIYGSTPNQNQQQSQNQTAFNPSTSFLTQPSSEQQQRPYHNNPTSYNFQSATSPTPLTATSLGANDGARGITPPFLSTSPVPIHEFSPPPQQSGSRQQSYYQSHSQHARTKSGSGSGSRSTHPSHITKRPRILDQADDSKDEEQDEMTPDQKVKSKAPGACGRCKNLKVRCEFKTENDPCKRCLNGGHDCVIPGRKKRRTPPKREHLLNQIREQAAQIQKLMSQLEAMNLQRQPGSANSDSFSHPRSPSSNGADLHSPVLSPSSTHGSYFGDGAGLNSNTPVNPETNKVVEDWIAKARESLAEFGGFIGIGGAGMPKSYLVDEDPEDEESGGEDEDGEIWEGEIAVEDSDEDVVDDEEGRPERKLRHQSSVSSLGTTSTSVILGQPRKKDAKLVTHPPDDSPFGLLMNMSLEKARRGGSSVEGDESDEKEARLGVADPDFFRSSPGPDPMRNRSITAQQQVPYILTRGVVTPEEAEKLFKIYFDLMNLSVSLLDPELYTAPRTCYRSPFLFTVICAIASRYYTERPELYSQAMHYAQLAAGTALISGHKTVEVCQAYILLSLYPVPARRWEEDRSWVYLGLAIRIALDLNLHHPTTAKPLNENHAREMLNRTRVWLNCFNLDRSTGSQYGKSPVISNADYIANHSEDWWKSSPCNMRNFDIHICAYNAELRVMAGFLAKMYSDPQHPTGLNKEVNFEQLATDTDEELKRLGAKWFAVLDQTDMSDPQYCFRTGLLRLAYSYARLVALSSGFQHAFRKNNTDENPFLMRCLAAATDVVNTVVDNIGRPSQRVYLRHGPEAQSVFVTFASAFLVKLLQPRFATYLTFEKRLEIRKLVSKVVDLLGSPEVAIDDRHGPKLYARFLKGLLATPMAKVDQSPNGMRSPKSLPKQRSRRPKSSSQTPEPDHFEIPFTVSNHSSPTTSIPLSPPPSQAAMSFDQFAPVGGIIDPFTPNTLGQSTDPTQDLGMNISMSDFFQPPLPFDHEILQSMQSLTDPSVWQDITLPGFNWMTQFQNSTDIHMRSNDSMLYDTIQFPSGQQQ